MKIMNVSLSGLDRLFEGYRHAADENRRTAYGRNITAFLNHCLISFEISELTTIEMYYLKHFSSSIHILDKTFSNFINAEKEYDINQKISGLLMLHDELINDSDIDDSVNSITNILPIGCTSYKVIANFKGPSIMSITGGFVEKIFTSEDGLDDIYIGNSLMVDRISRLFYESFYSFIANKYGEIDLVTEFMTTRKFYNYSENICDLAYLNTPYGEITFFETDQDKLAKQLKSIKEKQKNSPYWVEKLMYVTFICNTTFDVFMDMYLNTNYVVDHEDLKIILANDSVSLSDNIVDKYKARISNSMDYLLSYKKGLINSDSMDLNKLNFIFNGNKIKYSLQIPLSNIIEFTNQYNSTIDEIIHALNTIRSIYDTVKNLIG